MKANSKVRSLVIITVLLSQLLAPTVGIAVPAYQVSTPAARAQALLEQLTPEERVGQLFLVEFDGVDVTEGSPIHNLITDHHIGGVVLKAENDNFIGPEDTLSTTWQLIQSLQQAELLSSQQEIPDPTAGEPNFPAFIPLFVTISQDGDGYPYDQILHGLTPLPNPMAIGASWEPDLAYQVGEVLGSELNALGFNLLLGPGLNVLENPRPELVGDLGTRSFSGDPYWVGEMGRAYISGVHFGSQNRIAVVGKHFPGYGGLDRPPEEEIPTIRKSLEQLREVEFQPFYVVTGLAPSMDAAVDALLLSHSRYEAFQEDIRTTTRPISSDPQAFEQLMALPEFASWYAEGGLVISDELGTRAIRRFHDPSENLFNARLVALNTFLAGNDMLLLGDFVANDAPDSYVTIVRTLEFFALKYREDPAFTQRVDNAVLRILTLKFKLYESFTIDNVLTEESDLSEIGDSAEVTFDIARQAVTLFSPSLEDLDNALPSPPELRERMVVITDTFLASQCSDCPGEEVLATDALQIIATRLYGPEAGGLIIRQNLRSYSFSDLDIALSVEDDSENPMLANIQAAAWIVFVMLDIDEERPASQALRRFLSERPDLIQQKRIIVFALNAPYYLDSTDISKLTAYYGLYSKQPQFIEVAARVLFQELTTPGSSPVSIPGIGYTLSEATLPDQEQIYGLTVYPADTGPPPEVGEGTAQPPVEYRIGDTIIIETGMVLDHNGNPVPDSTPVQFLLNTTTADGSTSPRELDTFTTDGMARTSFILDTAGTLEIQAASGDPAALSEIVQIDVADTGEAGPIVVVTRTPPPTNVLTQITPLATPDGDLIVPPDKITLGDWLLNLLVIIFISLFAYQVGAMAGHVRWGIRWGMAALIGGLLVNTYLSFDLPGATDLISNFQIWGIVISTAIGTLFGWLVGFLWRYIGK
jgi:beta-N-acetylhexosaminidase